MHVSAGAGMGEMPKLLRRGEKAAWYLTAVGIEYLAGNYIGFFSRTDRVFAG